MKKGKLEQAIEREPHAEHSENYFISFSLYFFGCLTPNGIVDLICTFFFLWLIVFFFFFFELNWFM